MGGIKLTHLSGDSEYDITGLYEFIYIVGVNFLHRVNNKSAHRKRKKIYNLLVGTTACFSSLGYVCLRRMKFAIPLITIGCK